MTREEIMQMGRQAGSFIELAQEKDLLWLERFAKLVAQHEREACAKYLESINLINFSKDEELIYKNLLLGIAEGIRTKVKT
jgi:hypothetical protein